MIKHMEKCDYSILQKNPATEVTGLLGLIGDNISQSFHGL